MTRGNIRWTGNILFVTCLTLVDAKYEERFGHHAIVSHNTRNIETTKLLNYTEQQNTGLSPSAPNRL
jgi:hypothetical protein